MCLLISAIVFRRVRRTNVQSSGRKIEKTAPTASTQGSRECAGDYNDVALAIVDVISNYSDVPKFLILCFASF